MFKHLLVPLDGSDLSEKALTAARQVLALQGTITLLNVIDLPYENPIALYDMPIISVQIDHAKLLEAAKKHAHTYLHQVGERLRLPPTMTLNTEVWVGNATTLIVERAAALHVDGIVMCTHGRSGINRWMFGSVTQSVLTMMPCPVIVIPGQTLVLNQLSPADAHISAS